MIYGKKIDYSYRQPDPSHTPFTKQYRRVGRPFKTPSQSDRHRWDATTSTATLTGLFLPFSS